MAFAKRLPEELAHMRPARKPTLGAISLSEADLVNIMACLLKSPPHDVCMRRPPYGKGKPGKVHRSSTRLSSMRFWTLR
jgi:hypothetical protein